MGGLNRGRWGEQRQVGCAGREWGGMLGSDAWATGMSEARRLPCVPSRHSSSGQTAAVVKKQQQAQRGRHAPPTRDEALGAVNGVDDPQPLAAAAARQVALLFPKNGVVGGLHTDE